MDVVYILGTGSTSNDNEIRYSLRSIEKYLIGFNVVYIVGECPKFLKGIIHLDFRPTKKQGKKYL